MFERFTERARQIVVLAQEEARLLNHGYIGSEHILLGICREEEGLGARALLNFNVTADPVRDRIISIIGTGDEQHSGQIPFTPRGKKIFELALREALSLGHNYIGTEHILLGLLRENGGIGMRILAEIMCETDDERSKLAEKIRNEIIMLLQGPKQEYKLLAPNKVVWIVLYGDRTMAEYRNKPNRKSEHGVVEIWGATGEPVLFLTPHETITIKERT